jgi:hypothetical protein
MQLNFVVENLRAAQQREHRWRYTSPHPYDSELAAFNQEFAEISENYTLPVYMPPTRVNPWRQVYQTHDEAVHLSTEISTARLFLQTYPEHVAQSTSLDDFSKRMYIAANPDCLARALTALGGDRGRYLGRLTGQVHTFMTAHPEDAEAAFRIWEKRVATVGESGVADYKLYQGYRSGYDTWHHVVTVGDTVYQLQEPYFVDQIERQKEVSAPKSVRQAINILAFSEIKSDASMPILINQFQDMMLANEPRGKGRLMQASLDMLVNYMRFGGKFSPENEKLYTLLEAQKRKPGGLHFSFIIRLANAFEERLQGIVQEMDVPEEMENMSNLDETTVASLPSAIERLCLIAKANIDPATIDEVTDEVLDSLTHAASFAATVGADNKLDESVLTVGGLILRYPQASPAEIENLAVTMQETRSVATVHKEYRELRAVRRSKANFHLWVPGKGLLS